jgi:hypothetical protein
VEVVEVAFEAIDDGAVRRQRVAGMSSAFNVCGAGRTWRQPITGCVTGGRAVRRYREPGRGPIRSPRGAVARRRGRAAPCYPAGAVFDLELGDSCPFGSEYSSVPQSADSSLNYGMPAHSLTRRYCSAASVGLPGCGLGSSATDVDLCRGGRFPGRHGRRPAQPPLEARPRAIVHWDSGYRCPGRPEPAPCGAC